MPYTRRKPATVQSHICIDAGPGCGKTSTIEGAVQMICGKKPAWIDYATDEQLEIFEAMKGEYQTIKALAFNKAIADELEKRLPRSRKIKIEASTFHRHGGSVLKANGYRYRPNGDQCRYIVKVNLMGYAAEDRMSREDFKLAGQVKQVVSIHKNNWIEPTKESVAKAIIDSGIEVNNVDRLLDLVKNAMEISKEIKPGKFTVIDFDDMLWLPVVLGLDFDETKVDLLLVDESQDLNPVQHEIVRLSGERVVMVGDPRQAIYGFRGADSQSMNTLRDVMGDVVTLPLQISFRLPVSGVANVNSYAPALRPLPNAKEGTITKTTIDKIEPKPGDLIVSRVNANIFILAFKLLRERIPVRIQGREFGDQLIRIIREKCEPGQRIESAINAIKEFDIDERARLEKKQFNESLLDQHAEKIICLNALTNGCLTVHDMLVSLEELFNQGTPRESVVLLSTIHRAKGLEADRVYFLEPNLVPHPMAKTESEIEQEYNLKFVAETRHKDELVYVDIPLDYHADNADLKD
jgi:DNA helicase-2/ATP-dependent DNA helicase PcrA